jgi:hypothetical protein
MVAIKRAWNGVLGVQVTSGTNVSSHMDKALKNESLAVWLQSGNRFQLHGWRQLASLGKRKHWSCRTICFGHDGEKFTHYEIELP